MENNNIIEKKCSKCELMKPLDQFRYSKSGKYQVRGDCKECERKSNKFYKNGGIPIKKEPRYGVGKEDPTYSRRIMLMGEYNMTLEEYNKILDSQNGVCAICKEPETRMAHGTLRNLSVDHCHSSSKIRGLLCVNCNLAIGNFMDSPKLLLEAARYLIKSRLEDEKDEGKILEEINELLKKT